MHTVSERLRFIRENKYGKRGMAAFARQIGISPSAYLNYERGTRSIPSDVLIQIAKCASVNLHWLLTGDGSPYSNEEINNRVISRIREVLGNLLAELPPSKGEDFLDSSQSFSESAIPLLQSAPTLNSLSLLAKTDQTLLLDMIEQQHTRLNSFQSILHPDVIKGFDSAIKTEATEIQNLPQLAKHCLIRATLGTLASLLVPEVILYLAETDIHVALEYTRSLPNSPFNDKLEAYSVVIDRLLEKMKITESLQIIEEAMELVGQQDDPFERIRKLLPIARWYARCGEMGKAQGIIVEASGMLKPNLASQELIVKFYRQLAETESELGRLAQAKQLLRKSLALGKETLTDSEALNIHLSRCSLQYAFLSLKYVGQRNFRESKNLINQAKRLIEQISDPWHQVEALLTGIRGYYIYLDNFVQAWAILLQTIDIAQSISDPIKQSMALSRIIESFADEDYSHIGLAEDLANQIPDPMEASTALLSIAFRHIHHNNQERAKLLLNQAVRLAEKAMNIQGRIATLRKIADRLIRNREIHMALKLTQLAFSNDKDKVVLLLRFIRAFINQGDVTSASQKLEQIGEIAQQISVTTVTKDKLEVLIQIAITYWILGDEERANGFISKAQELLINLTKPEEVIPVLLELAEFYVRCGDDRKASQFTDEAETLARSIRRRSDALSAVACAWAKAHHPNKALEIVKREISDPVLKAQAIAQLAIAFSQSGDLRSALRLMPKVQNSIDRVVLLALTARILVESSKIDKAKGMINEAIQIADHINMPNNKSRAFASIAQALAKSGDQDQALHFLQKSLQNASQSNREIAIEIIGNLIPVISSLGGVQLLSEVYTELQRADEIFND